MASEPETLASTTGLCPTCLEPVPGTYERRDGSVYLRRECETHGTASRQVWADADHWAWAREVSPALAGDPKPAEQPASTNPDYAVDHDHACVAIVEVTQDCNLSCSYCFADSGPGGAQRPAAGVINQFEAVLDHGGPRPLQLSGGEPTVRDDLPALVIAARERGFGHIQVNTNGLRIAREDGYAERLVEAGVTALYLQFDGVTGDTYEAIREVDLWAEKQAAVEAAAAADLPVVLVPTVVPGVNDDEMGDVLRFALDNLDVVRSVNFQPVAHFGRVAERHGRFSLDTAAERLADQCSWLDQRDFQPLPSCSSHCQLTTVVVAGPGGPATVTDYIDADVVRDITADFDDADWMELLAGTSAGIDSVCASAGCCGLSIPDEASTLASLALPVTLTGFMDADAADADRLANCCLSLVTPDGELVPFCGHSMTTDDGEYALRNRHGWGGRPAVGEPVPAAGEAAPSDDD